MKLSRRSGSSILTIRNALLHEDRRAVFRRRAFARCARPPRRRGRKGPSARAVRDAAGPRVPCPADKNPCRSPRTMIASNRARATDFAHGLLDRHAEAGERSERKPGVVTPHDGFHKRSWCRELPHARPVALDGSLTTEGQCAAPSGLIWATRHSRKFPKIPDLGRSFSRLEGRSSGPASGWAGAGSAPHKAMGNRW